MRIGGLVKRCFVFLVVAMVLAGNAVSGLKKVNVQGKLTQTDGVTPITGSHDITLKVYDASNALVFAEKHLGVDLGTTGLLNIQLGQGAQLINPPNIALDSVTFDEQYYLGISVDAEAEMTERQTLGASPYSLGSVGDFNVGQTLVTNKLDSRGDSLLYSSNLPYSEGLSVFYTAGAATGGGLNFHLGAVGAVPSATSLKGYLRVRGNNGNIVLGRFNNGVESTPIEISNATGDVYLNAASGKVGIGTTSPAEKLTVWGGVGSFGSAYNGGRIYIGNDDGLRLSINTDGARNMKLAAGSGILELNTNNVSFGGYGIWKSNGYVGIGTDTPDKKFTVVDNVANGYTEPVKFNNPGANAAVFGSGIGLNIGNGSVIKSIVDDTFNTQNGGQALEIWNDSGGGNWIKSMKVCKSGSVVINQTGLVHGANLEVGGIIYASGQMVAPAFNLTSDERLKQNISEFNDSVLDKISQVKIIKYNWDKSKIFTKDMLPQKANKIVEHDEKGVERVKYQDIETTEIPTYLDAQEIGFSAQQLEGQFPALVETRVDGYKGIAFNRLVAVMFKAIQEHQAEIMALKKEIAALKLNR
ncbi:MAG TPA: hypothetical protein DEE98_04305 [Elusimicrobia bacterium]|nr:MAG: hypothetical protein A2386_06890 [Elusimicrobia bacterium RIFOXYB1_FULL_48_9]OGS16157.1 MAG: hypothetical protein A2251_00865 [Elusimicrobia bacterium RIFOXYA2_FULL_47_53]OGS31311.1 MAG: hypothetical protein A2323_09155 [Elusimicrobia bacterium RIFOXYB2_FULL_46_23]HBU69588.1 hypothetical protein [Elusimicrobiota bacterium]